MASDPGISDVVLAVIVGVSSLLGAGVGGAITGLVTLRAEQKRQEFTAREEQPREARERAQEEEARARSLQEAARLVGEELGDNLELVREAVRLGRYWPGMRELQADVWGRYRSILAREMSDDDWAGVTLGYEEVNARNWEVRRLRETEDPPAIDDDPHRRELRLLVLVMLEGRKACARAMGLGEEEATWGRPAQEIIRQAVPLEEEDHE